MGRLVFLCYNKTSHLRHRRTRRRRVSLSRVGSCRVAGFDAADAFGAVFFDALRGGMQREARAQTMSACPCGACPRNPPLLDKFQTLAPLTKALRAEGYRSLAYTEKTFYGEAFTLCGVIIRGLVLLLLLVSFR